MQYRVFVFSILLAGLAGCIGGVASADGSSNATKRDLAASSLRGSAADDARVRQFGGPVSVADYPYLAFVVWYWNRTHLQSHILPRTLLVTRETLFQCSGVFIGPKYTLTTASCFQPRIDELTTTNDAVLEWTPYEAWVRVGADDGWLGGRPQAQTSDILKIIVHESYVRQSNTHDVDVALLQMKRDFILEDNVKRPQFSLGIDHLERAWCHEVGFGKIDPADRSPKRPLHSHPVVLGARDYCTIKQILFDQSVPNFDNFLMCGQVNTTTPRLECDLDSGAPVVCSNMVTGILSRRHRGSTCGGSTDFSVYIKAPYSHVVSFILARAGYSPLIFPLPPSAFVPRDGNVVVASSSSTVLTGKVAAVALIACIAVRAV